MAKDYIKAFEGAFTLDKAEELYPDKGVQVMQAIAKAGRYGQFTDADLENQTFAPPAGRNKKVIEERRAAINEALSKIK